MSEQKEEVKLEAFTSEEANVVFTAIKETLDKHSAYIKPTAMINEDGAIKADIEIYKIVKKADGKKETPDTKTEKSS